MALEAAVVYQKGLFSHYDDNKDLHIMQENWSWDFNLPKEDQDQDPWELSPLLMVPSFSNETTIDQCDVATSSTRPKRRRLRTKKNKEEIENQRMTHISIERNRRKQMNEYLAALKSLMPDSYVQRSDQASIVGGAINYVKELEQNLHSLNAKKTKIPFDEFFSFPQYSMMTETSSIADVEVTMIESHANLKIRSKKHPKQLLKLVTGLQNLRLSILHLNVSTMDEFALYSFSVKVEDGSKLNSTDEVANVVHQLLGRIHEEAGLI